MAQYRSKSKGEKGKESHLDLSVTQVLAATGATTLGAILVKLLDIWGTVLGTAVLSVCTSIGAVLILRTVHHTGDRIKSQIAALSPAGKGDQAATVELGDDRVTATAAIPTTEELARLDGDTVVLDAAEPLGEGEYAAKPASRKRTLLTILVSSVLVFSLTIGVLFVIGSLTGDPGRFVQHQAPGETTTEIVETPEEDGTEPDGETGERNETVPQGEDPTDQAPTDGPTEDDPTEGPTTSEPTEDPTGGDEGTEGEETPTPAEESATEAPATD